jgi:hypothetical protein
MLALALFAVPAHAADRCVALGEVSSRVVREGIDYERLLRTASEQEISSLDLGRVARGRRVIVSVALVRLDTAAAQGNDRRVTDATCKVSATLRNARGGSVFAVLEGEARASSSDTRDAVETSAVHGALRGALGRIPDALRR